ncbi:hypothetical protein [Bradyrhizobium sp. LTSP849]|uniref:hypothetical protein n=1 Tax=Bradyrhizobium sp. LTSP849 TaxID=1615890 RepID=UPI0012E01D12|nr:hypothetical protein [Bradyrhizobium sp. LTSP849]
MPEHASFLVEANTGLQISVVGRLYEADVRKSPQTISQTRFYLLQILFGCAGSNQSRTLQIKQGNKEDISFVVDAGLTAAE